MRLSSGANETFSTCRVKNHSRWEIHWYAMEDGLKIKFVQDELEPN